MRIYKLVIVLLFSFVFLLLPQSVFAHAFGATYALPIPFWLYLYAGSAALLLSFLLIGFFTSSGKPPAKDKRFIAVSGNAVIQMLTSVPAIYFYKTISFFLFLLTILTGLFGEDISAFNFNMTFFWILFVVGFTYVTLLIGNIWSVINPWKVSIEAFEKVTKSSIEGVVPYPKKIRYYPAFILYVIFIGIELFGGTTPFSLSVILLQYTFITFTAVYLFGKKSWFQYGDFFSFFFRIISLSSPVFQKNGKILLRIPFSGLLHESAKDFSMILFILFMLSSTAFDGFRETNLWFILYWDYAGKMMGTLFSEPFGYQLFEILGLLLSPFVFLSLYMLCLLCMKYLVKTKQSLPVLASAFAFSLVPIAVVYNITHYFTLLAIQGQVIIRLISDPFGWGWDLFGTNTFSPNVGILHASFVWHFQVVLILLGHIVSVYLAHLIAIRVYGTNKKAVISQIPMLLLMIVYTMIGLWILSQPIVVR